MVEVQKAGFEDVSKLEKNRSDTKAAGA